MGKYFACSMTGTDCLVEARAKTEEQLMVKLAAHAKTAHGISPLTPDRVATIKSLIRDA